MIKTTKERRIAMDLGNKICELRKLSGITQEQLAEKLNISRQTLSKWEKGNSLPDIESIINISKLFQISLQELLLEKEEQQMDQQQNTQITLEDLSRINAHNRKMNLILCSGLLFLAIAILIATFENMLRSTTLSLNYILYRYIVTGQYDYAPVNYTKLFIPALLAGSIGIILCFFYFTKNNKN